MTSKKRDKSSVVADPYRQRELAKYDQPIASREFITTVLVAKKGPMDLEMLAEELGLTGDDQAQEALRRRVGAMLRDGQLIQNRRGGLVPVDTDALIAGRVSAHSDGFGFVIADDGDKDVYLNGKQMRQVLHGDRVVVCVTGIDHRGRREGRIVDVVERANKSLVGRLSIDRGIAVVLPDNKRIHQDLLIAPGELGEAMDGDMVVAEIVEQPTRRHQPVGRIIEILGQHLRPGMEIDVALHSHGIPVAWPEAVTEQAAGYSMSVEEGSAQGRKDVRDLPLITIDGADARDFDDAVWCERLDKGWRLLVAIADVANYVSPSTALDIEAVERGTSVYFPGRVVPMLPEILSNGLCSLNPDVDRLCMICEMTLDEKGSVRKTLFHNGIMRSHARLTYDQVSEMLTDKKSVLRKTHEPLVPLIEELHRLYLALARKRRKRGAIEFDSNETHIVFDENKKIREIVPIERNDAHKLIEECMILANIEAAAFLEKSEIPALYRVHAGPKADRLEDLRAFLALHTLSLGGGDSPTALDYASLAEQIADRPDRSVVQTVMLRSMQQAVYQPKNEGHFGLALDQYAHFTSPIRRYPDLLVHRAIKHALQGGTASDYLYSKDAMQVLGESCSMTERRAEEASRDVISWLKCEYMQDHVGSEFPGIVSAVTSFGLFVELVGIHVEGLVHITNLSHDYYRFEQSAQALKGERTGKQYHLGDAIVVRVAAVNLEERKIDFLEVSHKQSKRLSAASSEKKAHIPNQKEPRGKRRSVKSRQSVTEADALPAVVAESDSAEQRRQQKRKLKQQRRDEKRAVIRQARELEAIRVQAGDSRHVADKKPTAVGKKSASSERKSKGKTVVANGGAADAVESKVVKSAGASVNNSNKSETAATTRKKSAAKAANTSLSKLTGKAAGKSRRKEMTGATATSEANKSRSKLTASEASKSRSKLTASDAGKSRSKVTASDAGKTRGKVTASDAGKTRGKVTASDAGNSRSKAASATESGKTGKKTSAKGSLQSVDKVTGLAKKKAVSKATGKLASKKTGKKAGKTSAKIAGKTTRKIAGKSVAKNSTDTLNASSGSSKSKLSVSGQQAAGTSGSSVPRAKRQSRASSQDSSRGQSIPSQRVQKKKDPAGQ